MAAAWDRPEDDAREYRVGAAGVGDLRQFSTGGTYINFLTEDEGDDRTRAAYRTNYDRLARLKAELGSDEPVPDQQEHLSAGVSGFRNLGPA